MPKISIIIRTKNEEKWITFCLSKVFKQTIKDIEVIIADNNSLDYTVQLAKKFPVKVISVDRFTPGKAINNGVRASSGEFFVCLSAHCIPKHKKWLENLLRNFKYPNIAGAYGRQEPLAYSSDMDKRDLLITFGLDHRIQKKDSFFHNANSMIRRDVWDKIPFNEKVTNIEDRLWGKAVIKAGYNIIYEPNAEVIHYHGIHQDRDKKRCKSVVKIIGQHEDILPSSKTTLTLLNPQQLNITAFLPVRGRPVTVGNYNLLEKGLDTVIPAVPDYQPYWTRQGDILQRVDDSFMPRERKKPLFRGLIGLGCVV